MSIKNVILRSAIIVLVLLLAPAVYSQEYYFRQFSVKQGLPPTVYCAMEDSRGEMWIGTAGSGICRFDGIKISILDRESGLEGNIIRSVFEDRKGNIWIGSDNGLNCYDGKEIRSFADKGITEISVLAINEDKAGNIWVGTESAGLFRIFGKDSLELENFNRDNSALISNFIFDIDFDDYDRIWLSMVGGLVVAGFEDGKLEFTSFRGGYIPASNITCGEKDTEGNLWFGSYGSGVFKSIISENLDEISFEKPEFLSFLDSTGIWDIHWSEEGKGWIVPNDAGVLRIDHDQVLNRFNKNNGLQTDEVYRVLESRNKDIWFASLSNGMLKFNNKLIIKYNEGNGIKGTQVYDVAGGKDNDILIGTDAGYSAYKFENDIPVLNQFINRASGLSTSDVTSIEVSGNEIWLGSSEGLFQLKNNRLRKASFNDKLSSKKVNCLLSDSRGDLWIGTDYGYNFFTGGELYPVTTEDGLINNEVQTIIEDHNGDIWMGTLGGLVRIKGDDYSDYRDFNEEEGLSELSIHSLVEDSRGNLWIGTFGGGLFILKDENEEQPIAQSIGNEKLFSANIYSLSFLSDSILIAGNENGFDQVFLDESHAIIKVVHFDINDGFPGGKNNLNAIHIDGDGNVWFGNSEGLVYFNPARMGELMEPVETRITGIKLFYQDIDWRKRGSTKAWFNLPDDLDLPFSENHIGVEFSSVYFNNPSDLSYSYFLEGGRGTDWSPYQESRSVDFQGLGYGRYVFRVKCRNKFGITGNTASFPFVIQPPFWLKLWFITFAIVFILILIAVFFRLRLRKLQKEKIHLEKIVRERTQEVVNQRNQIKKQHDIVVTQNLEIESSIHYAERIQKAVMPTIQVLKEQFDESFVLFSPQHIVSGDFYWVAKNGDHIIFTAADCTGHGVPGAFMSMLGISYLNQIVNEENTVMPDLILNKLRTHIINSFQKRAISSPEDYTKDGMDIALCSFHLKTKKLYYAGAYNPLYLIRPGKDEPVLIEYPADKMPIGMHSRMDDFSLKEIEYKKGDCIYLFSDGFPDQFGGPDYKKFMKKKFREMILDHQDVSLEEQKEKFYSILCEWMSYEDTDGEKIQQTDDILVMGVKL